MLKEPTVLVLGAGASQPFGFPLGQQLVQRVCKRLTRLTTLDINNERNEPLSQIDIPRKDISELAKALRYSQLDSIDAFLEQNSRYITFGKIAIAAELIPFEQDDALFEIGYEKRNWYRYVWNQIAGDLDSLEPGLFTILTFNYDRSLEHFLFRAACNSYATQPPKECAGLVSRIRIIHLHGSLGEYCPLGTNGLPYSSAASLQTIKKAADSIRIVHENINSSDQGFSDALTALEQAKHIFFLGFGYHPKNMERLRLNQIDTDKDVRGTAMGLTTAEKSRITSFARALKLTMSDWDCYNFVREVDICA